jgi:hypothetical protein
MEKGSTMGHRRRRHTLWLGFWSLVLLPGISRAAQPSSPDLDHIQVKYWGGPVIEHPRVATLFWGKEWKQDSTDSALAQYLNAFLQDLFADGRFMMNLSQYSVGPYKIGNGQLLGTATDDTAPPARVTDDQSQSEIQAMIAAGQLPARDANAIYCVFLTPHVVAENNRGEDSEHDFLGYHNFVYDLLGGDEFAYMVIPYSDDNEISPGNPHLMTSYVSHELAESVTDPRPSSSGTAWYDSANGEIGDIPVSLYYVGRMGQHDVWDVLEGASGRRYLVQKEWSNRDGKPVAFATAAGGS